jgi:alpha-galactosidase
VGSGPTSADDGKESSVSENGRITITWVGGGSYNWGPLLLRDIILTEGLQEARLRLLDIDRKAAEEMTALGRKLTKEWGVGVTCTPMTDQREALEGADFVLITINTGGVEATAKDIRIPEAFGVYATVGDTVGPGGWARALRNFPVFRQLGEDIAELAPAATVLNYSNPMSILTKVLSLEVGERVVGLCHGVYENFAVLQALFGLKDVKELMVNYGGLNHFFWVYDFTVRGEPGYEALQERLGRKSLADAVRAAHRPDLGFNREKLLTSQLYETYHYLPYMGDRHICEFLPGYVNGPVAKAGRARIGLAGTRAMDRYRLERTPSLARKVSRQRAHRRLLRFISGKDELPRRRSRETAADIMAACALGHEFIDVMNVPNRGQIPNLPLEAVVETPGVINSLGFTPLAVGPLPEGVLDLVLPHAVNQDRIVEACYTGELEEALESLAHDPTCSHLTLAQVKELGKKLVAANRPYLTQFFSGT